MKNLSKKQWVIGGVVVFIVVIVFIGFIVIGDGNGHEKITVERRNLVDDVNIAGSVKAGTVADLGFEVSGRIVNVLSQEGDEVKKGQTLITLDLGTLSAELLSSQANLNIKEAEVANAHTNLDDIVAEQDTLVANAYSILLSSGLVAEPSSDAYTQTTPFITGLYSGTEGTYKARVKYVINRQGSELRVFDLENLEPIDIDDTKPTPLGTKGLFITFPDTPSAYKDTIWYVTIPNNKSSVYAANYNAYQEALRTRDIAIEEAQSDLKDQSAGTSIAQAELLQAQAEVARVQAEIGQKILRAPFDGIMTQIEVSPGEIVSANTLVASIISIGVFGIEVDLPEIDSVKVNIGDMAIVTLDAFGDEEEFVATVASINRTETIVDNVAVYEARLFFDNDDVRITSGMTADVTITTDTKENVLAIPARAIRFREDGAMFVLVERDGGEIESEITTGLRGSDGFVEIKSGVSEGETILISKL